MGQSLILIALLLGGCTPYVSYMHVDATPLHNDRQAYDFICGGGEAQKGRFRADLAACENVRGGTYFRAEGRILLGKK